MPNVYKPSALAVQDSLWWYSCGNFFAESKILGWWFTEYFLYVLNNAFCFGKFSSWFALVYL